MISKYTLLIWALASFFVFSKISSKPIKIVDNKKTSTQTTQKASPPLPITPKEKKTNEETLKEIEVDNALKRASLEKQLTAALADIKMEVERLKLEKELLSLKKEMELEEIKRKHEVDIAKLKSETELLTAEIELENTRITKDVESFNRDTLKLQKKIQKLKLEHEEIEATLRAKSLDVELNKHASNLSEGQLINPLKKDGTLVISERQIKLNGIITPWKAKYIIDSISFYNNKNSELPIFLILENSPGGSVLAGNQIIKAIEDSKSPIYVVVKGFAASMAAIITTLAKKSFILKNAVMIHHQPSCSVNVLNVRKAKELYDDMKEWHKRFLGPVAKKMGISLEKLDELFYKNDADGDWHLFGDQAVEKKWADHIITSIQEIGVQVKPEMNDYTLKKFIEEYFQFGFDNTKKNTEEESTTLYLTSAHDFYYMYDPKHMYKVTLI